MKWDWVSWVIVSPIRKDANRIAEKRNWRKLLVSLRDGASGKRKEDIR